MIGRWLRSWLFTPTPHPNAPSPDDRFRDEWRVGDLGQCVDHGQWVYTHACDPTKASGPKVREYVRVKAVGVHHGYAVLMFVGYDGAYLEKHFRKVPKARLEAQRSAWNKLLKDHTHRKHRELVE